jgi:DNA-binding transcriptional MerR regulator
MNHFSTRTPDRLKVNEVAAILRVHPRAIRRWACDQRFASSAVHQTYRILGANALHWLHR